MSKRRAGLPALGAWRSLELWIAWMTLTVVCRHGDTASIQVIDAEPVPSNKDISMAAHNNQHVSIATRTNIDDSILDSVSKSRDSNSELYLPSPKELAFPKAGHQGKSSSENVNAISSRSYISHSKEKYLTEKNSSVINPHNYEYTINQQAFCDGNVYLLIVVCSAVEHFAERQAIRETWGHLPRSRTKVIFFLGIADEQLSSKLGNLQTQIEKENKLYQDIIQEDFVDSYKNLSVKSVAVLKWISTFCTDIKYMLKTDDDMFINVPVLLQDLHNSVHSRFIMGDIIAGAQPITDSNSKWYTPKSVFSDTMYPKYVSGTAYVISGDLIGDLYNATLHTNLFWLEDIYVTGLCARKVEAKHIFNGKFGYRRRILNPCLYRLVITGHRLRPGELRQIWKELQQRDLKCQHTRINLGNAE